MTLDDDIAFTVVSGEKHDIIVPDLRTVDTLCTLPVAELISLAIKKWETVAAYHQAGNIYPVGSMWTCCALCVAYWNIFHCTCCPIGEQCDNTPYEAYMFAQNASERMYYAKEEIAFLKDLKARYLEESDA